MEESNKLFETFDHLDENELTLVLNQVARRMMMLRCTTPDVAFWYGVLMRVNKWLATEPIVNETEKKYLLDPPTNISGRVRAIKNMRERSGMNMAACKAIVDDWIKENLNAVHDSVRASYLSSEKNRRESNISL